MPYTIVCGDTSTKEHKQKAMSILDDLEKDGFNVVGMDAEMQEDEYFLRYCILMNKKIIPPSQ